jgi:hypothetical protein
MNRAEALQKRADLLNDEEFRKKVVAGDAISLEQLKQIAQDIVGTPENWSRAPSAGGYVRGPNGEVILDVRQ